MNFDSQTWSQQALIIVVNDTGEFSFEPWIEYVLFNRSKRDEYLTLG